MGHGLTHNQPLSFPQPRASAQAAAVALSFPPCSTRLVPAEKSELWAASLQSAGIPVLSLCPPDIVLTWITLLSMALQEHKQRRDANSTCPSQHSGEPRLRVYPQSVQK